MSQRESDLFYRSFATPKKGNSDEEYEDAFAGDAVTGRFAVADGASESIYAGEWAAILCDMFVADPAVAENIPKWQTTVQDQWLDLVNKVAQTARPWYVEEKLQDGAFATFLGLTIGEAAAGNPHTWRAWAVGDSCLFLIHGDDLKLAFPVEKSAGFGTRPELIGSRQRSPVTAASIDGTLASGDCLLLMTDALAQWFLAQHEAGHKPWQELLRLTSESFPAWVDLQRQKRRVKNDDMTLVAIQIHAVKK
jgi:Stage II sporulation protein E (SpoIIE)